MVRITTPLVIENLHDCWDAERDARPMDAVRRLKVSESCANDQVLTLAIPRRFIRQLGLQASSNWRPSGTEGQMYGPVRLAVYGRPCTLDVFEAPDDSSVQIGRLALIALNLVVDPVRHVLTENTDAM